MSGESPSVAQGLSKREDIALVPQDKPRLAARMDIGCVPEGQRALFFRRRDSERRPSASEPLAAVAGAMKRRSQEVRSVKEVRN
jgi:hypothetical protein